MTVSTRHIRRGTMRVIWAPTIPDTAAPSTGALGAGTDFTGDIRSVNSWELERTVTRHDTVDSYSGLLLTEGDRRVVGQPAMELYDEGTGNSSLRTTLAEGAKGYVCFCLDGTPVIGDRAVVWPVISMGPVDRLTGEHEAAVFTVEFMIWEMPEENGVIA